MSWGGTPILGKLHIGKWGSGRIMRLAAFLPSLFQRLKVTAFCAVFWAILRESLWRFLLESSGHSFHEWWPKYAINIKKCASLKSKSGYPKPFKDRGPKKMCRASFLEEIFFVGLICIFSSPGQNMGTDQYLLIPFLGGWTSIYQLFWCSPGVQGFDTLPYVKLSRSQKKVSALLHNFLIVLLVLLLFRFSLRMRIILGDFWGRLPVAVWTNWVSWLSPNSMGISGS